MTIIPKFLNTNFEKGRGGKHPELIVIHVIGLPGLTAESAYQHFSNPNSEVSAHYIIKRTGEIWHLIADEDTAWANGSISYKNGVPLLPTNPMAKNCWQKGGRINQISLSLENEGSEYEDITEAQYRANVELIKELSRKFGVPIDSTHICGHREIKRDKLCPGRISVGKIIAMSNAPIAPVAPTIPVIDSAPRIEINPPIFAKPQWLLNLEDRVKVALGFADPMFGGVPRSSKWNKVRKQYLATHPVCEVCGKKGTLLKPLNIHHKKVYHLHPELELDLSNLCTLCRRDHELIGHLSDFSSWNESIDEDVKYWHDKIKSRP